MAHTNEQSPPESLSDQVAQNLAEIAALQRREWQNLSRSQRRVERLSRLIGCPTYMAGVLLFSVTWIVINTFSFDHYAHFDPAPYPLLAGVLTLVALMTTTIVLVAQNRQTRFEHEHAHLDLQVNLLTEQKVTKLIGLIEELRRDLPMVKDRHDPHAAVLQEGAAPKQVFTAIKELGLVAETEPPDGNACTSDH